MSIKIEIREIVVDTPDTTETEEIAFAPCVARDVDHAHNLAQAEADSLGKDVSLYVYDDDVAHIQDFAPNKS